MSYDYKYEEPKERAEFVKIPEGEYDFKVKEAYALTESKNHNLMLPLDIIIKGFDTVITDRLVLTDKAKYKIDAFLKCVGKNPAQGQTVDLANASWLRGAKGRCKVVNEPYDVVQEDGTVKTYDSNKIAFYIFEKARVVGTTVTAPAPSVKPDVKDDIPW